MIDTIILIIVLVEGLTFSLVEYAKRVVAPSPNLFKDILNCLLLIEIHMTKLINN